MASLVTLPRRHVINKVDAKYGIIPYDSDNLYPQRMLNIIASSGASTICAKWFSKFIFGKGLDNQIVSKKIVNRKNETFEEILKKCINSYSLNGSFAVHFNYNLLGEIVEMQFVPFEYVRMESESGEVKFTGRFKIYNDWDTQKKKTISTKDIIIVNQYNPAEVLNEIKERGIENYNGQLFYLFREYGTYPVAILDAEIESSVCDSEIKEFNYSNVQTGFLGAHVAEYPYKFEDDTAREQETENINNLQGARNATKIIMVENEYADTKPFRFHELRSANVDTMFLNTEKTVRERIRKMYEVPPAFLDAVSGSLGANNIKNAYDFYNSVTADYRLLFQDIFSRLTRGWDNNIIQETKLVIRPLQYQDEAVKDGGTDNFAATALNGAQVTSLVEIVTAKNAGTLTQQAAVQLIISAFPSITLETANKIVGQNVNQLQQFS